MVTNPPPPPPRYFWGTLRQPRKLIFGLQPYFYPPKNEKWKTTSKKNEMEDDLNFKAYLTTKSSKKMVLTP
jgi:hypothetical protein